MKKNGRLLAIVFRLWKKSSKAKKTDEKPTPVSEELEEVSETMRVKEVCGRTSDSELGANEGERQTSSPPDRQPSPPPFDASSGRRPLSLKQ